MTTVYKTKYSTKNYKVLRQESTHSLQVPFGGMGSRKVTFSQVKAIPLNFYNQQLTMRNSLGC